MTSRLDLERAYAQSEDGLRKAVMSEDLAQAKYWLGLNEGTQTAIHVCDALTSELTRIRADMTRQLAVSLGCEGASDFQRLLRRVERIPRFRTPSDSTTDQKKGNDPRGEVVLPFSITRAQRPSYDGPPMPPDTPLPLAPRKEQLTPEQAQERWRTAVKTFEENKDELELLKTALELAMMAGGGLAVVARMFGIAF